MRLNGAYFFILQGAKSMFDLIILIFTRMDFFKTFAMKIRRRFDRASVNVNWMIKVKTMNISQLFCEPEWALS